MKQILCTGGEVALVDDEDYPLLARHSWATNGGYVTTGLNTMGSKSANVVYMHNVILGFGVRISYRDGNPLNNQKENLHRATKSQNGANQSKALVRGGKPTSSKYKGVHWSTRAERWKATIQCNSKLHHLGSFDNENDAAIAYNEKATELFGEYALLNVIEYGSEGK